MKKGKGKGKGSLVAVYPGSFDPVTNGHIDIIERGSRIFDTIIIAILKNLSKEALFAVVEREKMMKQAVREIPGVLVKSFDGLLIDFALRENAGIIVRGLRATSDFEYEFQMTLMNRRLNSSIETVFMMPSVKYTFLSSKLVKEVVALGGDVAGLVPTFVEKKLREKVGR